MLYTATRQTLVELALEFHAESLSSDYIDEEWRVYAEEWVQKYIDGGKIWEVRSEDKN